MILLFQLIRPLVSYRRLQQHLLLINVMQKAISNNSKVYLLACLLPQIILIPATSSFSSPLQFRRSQDFSISSDLQFLCNQTYPVTIQWIIRNCTSNCSWEIQLDSSVITTYAELYIPGRTLPYGLYQFKLIIQSAYASNLSISSSAYAKIDPSGITANLVPLGTSMITRGSTQDLQLDPGSYSVDPDENTFDTKVSHSIGTQEICSLILELGI